MSEFQVKFKEWEDGPVKTSTVEAADQRSCRQMFSGAYVIQVDELGPVGRF